jgi:hypothetical protein
MASPERLSARRKFAPIANEQYQALHRSDGNPSGLSDCPIRRGFACPKGNSASRPIEYHASVKTIDGTRSEASRAVRTARPILLSRLSVVADRPYRRKRLLVTGKLFALGVNLSPSLLPNTSVSA